MFLWEVELFTATHGQAEEVMMWFGKEGSQPKPNKANSSANNKGTEIWLCSTATTPCHNSTAAANAFNTLWVLAGGVAVAYLFEFLLKEVRPRLLDVVRAIEDALPR